MLNKTALLNRSYLKKVLVGMRDAMRAAGVGVRMVTNRRGAASLLVVWRRGDGFEFITPMSTYAGDVDVTGPVLRALRDARRAIKGSDV